MKAMRKTEVPFGIGLKDSNQFFDKYVPNDIRESEAFKKAVANFPPEVMKRLKLHLITKGGALEDKKHFNKKNYEHGYSFLCDEKLSFERAKQSGKEVLFRGRSLLEDGERTTQISFANLKTSNESLKDGQSIDGSIKSMIIRGGKVYFAELDKKACTMSAIGKDKQGDIRRTKPHTSILSTEDGSLKAVRDMMLIEDKAGQKEMEPRPPLEGEGELAYMMGDIARSFRWLKQALTTEQEYSK